jgi:hypothetical protein
MPKSSNFLQHVKCHVNLTHSKAHDTAFRLKEDLSRYLREESRSDSLTEDAVTHAIAEKLYQIEQHALAYGTNRIEEQAREEIFEYYERSLPEYERCISLVNLMLTRGPSMHELGRMSKLDELGKMMLKEGDIDAFMEERLRKKIAKDHSDKSKRELYRLWNDVVSRLFDMQETEKLNTSTFPELIHLSDEITLKCVTKGISSAFIDRTIKDHLKKYRRVKK